MPEALGLESKWSPKSAGFETVAMVTNALLSGYHRIWLDLNHLTIEGEGGDHFFCKCCLVNREATIHFLNKGYHRPDCSPWFDIAIHSI